MQAAAREALAVKEANLEAAAAILTVQEVAAEAAGSLAREATAAAAATSGLRDAAGAAASFAGSEAALGHALDDINATLLVQVGLLQGLDDRLAGLDGQIAAQSAMLGELRDAWLRTAAAVTAYRLAAAGAGNASRDAGAGAAAAGAGFRVLGTGLRITGTALHWIVAGTFEFLAVAIPAVIAFGAGLVVAAQGAQNAQIHLSALYNTMEAVGPAFHQTAGQVLGLGDALQQAQNKANPGVYEILGSVINDLKARMGNLAGVGLQVVHMWDEFSARVTVDMQGAFGAQVQGLLAGMVTYLQEFGQILGNTGHAVLDFASAMPGLAAVLLAIATAISQVILWVSQLPPWLITTAMVFEEVYRWGGLVANLIPRIANAIAGLGPAILSGLGASFATAGAILAQFVGVGARLTAFLATLAGRLIGIIPGATGATNALGKLSLALTGLATNAALMTGIAVAAAAVIGLGVALDHARNAAQQFIDTSNKAIQAASGFALFGTIGTAIDKATLQIAQQEAVLRSYPQYSQDVGNAIASMVSGINKFSPALGGAAQGFVNVRTASSNWVESITNHIPGVGQVMQKFFNLMGTGTSEAASQIDALKAAQNQWAQQALQSVTNAQTLANVFHTTLPAAISLAQMAGVNLNQTWIKGSMAMKIAEQQVRNLLTGLGAMSAPAGVVGADMNALAIQSGLASTKVQQLNSAWDAWISSVTGGAASMAQVQTALAGMANSAAGTSSLLSGAISSVDRIAKGSSYTLRGFGQNAMQSWQQFTSAIDTGNTALDSLRTGMAEGAVSNTLFASTVKGLVGEMAPFTQGNAAAVTMLSQLAHEAGGPTTTSLKQLQQWAGVAGNAARDQFAKGILAATVAMGNMNAVAAHLGVTIQGQLTSQFSQAIMKAVNYQGAVNKVVAALHQAHPAASAVANAMKGLNAVNKEAATLQQRVGQALNHTTTQAHATASATHGAAASTHDYSSAAAAAATAAGNISSATRDAATAAGVLKAHTDELVTALHSHSVTALEAGTATNTLNTHVGNLSSTEQSSQGTRDTLNQQLQQQQTRAQTAATAIFNLQQKTANASAAALTAAAKMLTLASSITQAGNQAATAANQVANLAASIMSLQSKTVTITTNMVTTATHRAAGGPVAAGMPYTVGETGPELFVPFQSGWIHPASETRQFTTAGGGGGSGWGGSGGGVIHLEAQIHSHAYLDNKEVWTGIQQETLQYNLRNGNAQSGRLAPGRGR